MSNRNDWTNVLDEMLTEIDDGIHIAQTGDTANKKTTGDSLSRKTTARVTSADLPFVSATIENTYFQSRYSHFTTWINNLNFINYPDEKKIGFTSAINTYLEMANSNKTSFKKLDIQVVKDIKEAGSKLRENPTDPFLNGYCDALLTIKKVLGQSKLVRFQELSNKLK